MALRESHTRATVIATGLLLLSGVVLTVTSRAAGLESGAKTAAMIGPVAFVLGVGMAVHGAAMPPAGVTRVTRIWGLIGSAFAALNLWTLGFFGGEGFARTVARVAVPVALVVVWLLPARFYGERSTDQGDRLV